MMWFIGVGVACCLGSVDEDAVTFCERFLELVTDLEAQLPTRRFFNTLLDSCNFVVSQFCVSR